MAVTLAVTMTLTPISVAQIPSDVVNLLGTILLFFIAIVAVACIAAVAILYVLLEADQKKKSVRQGDASAKGPVARCKVCGVENPTDANFCQKCGQALR